jgi:hypothetical protein
MKTDREKPDFKTMSEAVQAWYRFYELDPKDGLSHVLCQAAIDFYQGRTLHHRRYSDSAHRKLRRNSCHAGERAHIGRSALTQPGDRFVSETFQS